MSKARFQLSTGDFKQDWNGTDTLSTTDNWDNIAHFMGHRGDDLVAITGADPRSITSASTSERVVDYFTSISGNPSAGGVFLAKLTNPTIALNGSGTADAPSITLYLDSTGRQDIRFQANIRDIDASADNAVQQVAVQWRVSDGSWNNVAYVADATAADSDAQVTTIDVTLPAGANDSASLEIRIITTNAAGNDEAVGIDDIVVSSIILLGGDTGAPVLVSSNPTDPDDNATAVPLTSNIILRFSEFVVAGTGSFTLSNGSDVRIIEVNDSRITIEGTTVTINPNGALVAGTTYTLTAPAGILKDTAGNVFEGIAVGLLDFTTAQPLLPRSIGEIQGTSHTSPFVGQMVQTEGVVTAIDTNGFYIQSAVGASDGNTQTSDGIFVFTSTEPTVILGSLLRVTAIVQEFLPGGDTRNLTITQLANASWSDIGNAVIETTTIGSGGRLLPTQIIDNDSFVIYDPDQDGIDFWESLEGMLVTINEPVAISNTNSFGETYVVASGGAGATGQASGGGLTIAVDDANAERIQLDNDNGLFASFNNKFSIGDRLSSVTGVVSYSFQSFEVLVTQAVTTTLDVTATKEITKLTKAADKLSIASYNLENLSANDAPTKIVSLASDIVNSLKSPDIIGVQEIQDADGTGLGSDLSGTATAAALIAAIKAAGGPTYAYAEIAPSAPGTTGGEPGGNIRNGYLYDPARVTLIPDSLQLIDGPAFSGSRKPLVASFGFNGETITFINVHFTSRSGSNALWGATQPPKNAGDTARTAQGETVRAWIEAHSSSAPSNIVVLGDFNGFTWEGGISALTRNELMQNLSDLLPAEERYSYQFEGNNQQIDHIVVTGPLFRRAQFDAVQTNSQLPAAQQVSTDHDPVLALFTIALPVDTTAPIVTTFSPTDGATDVTASVNIILTFSEAIARGTGIIEIRAGSATGAVIERFDVASSSRLTFSGGTVAIDPTNNLTGGTRYFVVLPSGAVRDTAGNSYIGTSTYDFTIAQPTNSFRVTASDGWTGAIGGNGLVYGTSGYQDIKVLSGAVTFDASFNKGGDIVRFDGAASSYTVTRAGSSAQINAGSNLSAVIPVGTAGMVTSFSDGARKLVFANSNFALGAQTFSTSATTISAAADGTSLPTGATSSASARISLVGNDLRSGQTSHITIGGKAIIYGNAAKADVVAIASGVNVDLTFDASFNRGGDTIILDKSAGSYSAIRSGASIILTSTSQTLTIPVGTSNTTIRFADDSRALVYSTSEAAIKLGTQTIATTSTAISSSSVTTSLDVGTSSSTTTVSGADGKVIFTDDATKSSYVKITNFGSDDIIRVTGATEDKYSFTKADLDGDGQADDLSITFSNPDAGIVNDIQIINAVSSTAFVGDKATAISAVGFNFISFG